MIITKQINYKNEGNRREQSVMKNLKLEWQIIMIKISMSTYQPYFKIFTGRASINDMPTYTLDKGFQTRN